MAGGISYWWKSLNFAPKACLAGVRRSRIQLPVSLAIIRPLMFQNLDYNIPMRFTRSQETKTLWVTD